MRACVHVCVLVEHSNTLSGCSNAIAYTDHDYVSLFFPRGCEYYHLVGTNITLDGTKTHLGGNMHRIYTCLTKESFLRLTVILRIDGLHIPTYLIELHTIVENTI